MTGLRSQYTVHEIDFLRVIEVVKKVIEGVVKFVTEHPIIYRTTSRTIAQRTARREDTYGKPGSVSGEGPLLARRLGDDRNASLQDMVGPVRETVRGNGKPGLGWHLGTPSGP